MSDKSLNLALPGNPRYQPKDLQEYFGYDYLFREVAEVEIATMKTLAEIGIIPAADMELLGGAIEYAVHDITTSEVVEQERVTQHDVRAWVQLAQAKLPPPLRRWLHVPLTSYDALDTARSLQFARAHDGAVAHLTHKVLKIFADKVQWYAPQVQIGRTHGQHALPITVGFWLATISSRILRCIISANIASAELVGKISGAVGAYNAQVGLGIPTLCGDESFEARVLRKLELRPAPISTQILPPEPLADYLFACLKLSAALGQFGRDCRHLMRTEIGEVSEPFEEGQVGSSTMAHKRNPANFENLEGTYNKNQAEFLKVTGTMISEHQRDLVGSSVARDFPTIVVNTVQQLSTLLRKKTKDGKPVPDSEFLNRIRVDVEACSRNFKMEGDKILAEPMYITLQQAGYDGDAHHLVNHKAMKLVRTKGLSLRDSVHTALLEENLLGDRIWNNIPPETLELLGDPYKYTGIAREKALEIVAEIEGYLRGV